MITELLEIERALRILGTGVAPRHKDVKPLAKRAVLRAFVNTATGSVERVAVLSPDEAQRFWRMGNNQKGFPLLTIGPRDDKRPGKVAHPTPLRPRADSALLKKVRSSAAPNERSAALRSLFSTTSPRVPALIPRRKHRDWLTKQRQALGPLASTEAAPILALFDWILSDSEETRLLQSLDDALTQFAQSQPLNADELSVVARIAFLGGGEVLLDTMADATGRHAADPANVDLVSKALLTSSSPSSPEARCLISGETGSTVTGPFPQARLPILGNVTLFDRNPDTPSARRYGQTGSGSCRVSGDLADRLKAAAEALTTKEREGKTWTALMTERPSPKPGTKRKPPPKDLLLSFVTAPVTANIADAVTRDPAIFEILAQDIVKLAKGSTVDLSEHVSFIVIRKLTKGNQKVVLRATSSLAELVRAAKLWSAGCRNFPLALVKQTASSGGAKPVEQHASRIVVPAALVAIGKRVFIRGGTEHYEAPGPTFADAMQLFLGTRSQRRFVAARLLPAIIARGGPLVMGWKHAVRRGDRAGFDGNQARDVLTVISLLLHAQQRTQEVYMEDAAFRLGQLFAGADLLHRGYCEHQRKGDLPSALLGNQMLAIAARDPIKALDVLLQRWRVYAGWADKYRNKIDKPTTGEPREKWAVYNAVWAPINMKGIAESVRGHLPQMVLPIFRAELLLGYIAGLPRRNLPNASAAAPGSEQAAHANLEE